VALTSLIPATAQVLLPDTLHKTPQVTIRYHRDCQECLHRCNGHQGVTVRVAIRRQVGSWGWNADVGSIRESHPNSELFVTLQCIRTMVATQAARAY